MESRFLSGVQEPWGLRIRAPVGPKLWEESLLLLEIQLQWPPLFIGHLYPKRENLIGFIFVTQTKVFCTSSLKVDLVYALPMCHWLWLGSRCRAILCGRKPFTAVSMHGPIVSCYSQPPHEVGTITNFIVFSLWDTDFISFENISRNGIAVSYGSSEPTPVLLPEESHEQRSLVGYSP